MILADPGLMYYAAEKYPQLRLHLSVQGSATNYEAINFYRQHFCVARAVLPRVLSLGQVEQVTSKTQVEIEVFGFGSLCVMVEGDTELGLLVKNTLDAIELPVFDLAQWSPERMLARFKLGRPV